MFHILISDKLDFIPDYATLLWVYLPNFDMFTLYERANKSARPRTKFSKVVAYNLAGNSRTKPF